MRTCKTCREYPCRDWERRDKHDKRHDGNNPAAAGARPDPAASRTPGNHRPRTAQNHPAQEVAEGQVSEVADQGSGCIVGVEYGPVGDYLHTAGGTDLKGKAPV